MAESKFEQTLQGLLAKVNASDPAMRNIIYEKLRVAVRRHPSNVDNAAYERSSASLEHAITQSEARYADFSPPRDLGRVEPQLARAEMPVEYEPDGRSGSWVLVLAALVGLAGPVLDFVTPVTDTLFGLSGMTVYFVGGLIAAPLLWLLSRSRLLAGSRGSLRTAAVLCAIMVVLSGVPVVGGQLDPQIRERGAIAALLPFTREAQDMLVRRIASQVEVAKAEERAAEPVSTATKQANPAPAQPAADDPQTDLAEDSEKELAGLGISRMMWPDAFARSIAGGDVQMLGLLVRAGYTPQPTGLAEIFARAKWSPEMEKTLQPVSKQVGEAVCDPAVDDVTREPLLLSLGTGGFRALCTPHRGKFVTALQSFSESYRKEMAALELVAERRRQCSVDVDARILASKTGDPLADYFPEAEFEQAGAVQKSRQQLLATLEDSAAFHEFTKAEIDAMSPAQAYCNARVPKTGAADREKASMEYAQRVLAMIST